MQTIFEDAEMSFDSLLEQEDDPWPFMDIDEPDEPMVEETPDEPPADLFYEDAQDELILDEDMPDVSPSAASSSHVPAVSADHMSSSPPRSLSAVHSEHVTNPPAPQNQNDMPILPVANGDGCSPEPRQQDALAGRTMKHRIRGKSGMAQENKDALFALQLRQDGIVQAYDALPRDKKTVLGVRLRKHVSRIFEKLKNLESFELENGIVLHCRSQKEFHENEMQLRQKVYQDMALSRSVNLPVGSAGWAARRWLDAVGHHVVSAAAKASMRPDDYLIRSDMALITSHGDFGVSDLKQLPPSTYTVQLLEAWCRRQPSIVSCWDAVCNRMLSVKDRFKVNGIAFCLEVCSKTWQTQGQLKLHFHAWVMQRHTKSRLTLKEFNVDRSGQPFAQALGGRSNRGMSAWSGCYYVCALKIGQVFKFTNKEPHVDFAVKPDWVIRLYASDKMLIDHARDDLIRQVSRASDYLEQLTFHEKYKEARLEQEQQKKMLAAIMAAAKPPRVPEGIEAWQKQWEEGVKDRYKFLVLESESRMGKTRFVQSALVDAPEQALILDCADAVVPALKGNYVRSKHPLIMFDEAHAEMVIRCKKLFQASINPVTYGSSPTNAFVHTVWMHGVKMVIGSNCWSEELRKLEEADREWIKNNSVYIFVDSPLWID